MWYVCNTYQFRLSKPENNICLAVVLLCSCTVWIIFLCGISCLISYNIFIALVVTGNCFVCIQILRSCCHNEDDYSYEEVDEMNANLLVQPFCPSQEPNAPQVTMTSAIRLVNRLHNLLLCFFVTHIAVAVFLICSELTQAFPIIAARVCNKLLHHIMSALFLASVFSCDNSSPTVPFLAFCGVCAVTFVSTRHFNCFYY